MTKIIAFKGYQPKGKIPAAELLRFYRTRSNLTQFELAQRIGLKSERVIRKWENGQSLPEASRLKKLIEFYITGKFLTRFQEEAEAYNLWEAVKETFDFQSASFETYTIFDHSWFAELTGKVYQNQSRLIQFTAGNQLPHNNSNSMSGLYNFPIPRDSFIGREEQVAQIRDKLFVARLLTITGPPGVGKTRLALEVCRNLTDWFKDGIFLVNLESLTDPEALLRGIGQVSGLKNETEGPSKLLNFLQDKELLLVLDLVEPFSADSRQFIELLLRCCEKVKVLITCRESSDISEEKIFLLEPLPVTEEYPPNQNQAEEVDQELAGFPAGVRLFAERAMAVQSEFEFNDRTAPVIARICRQLDGLPLAIELAAPLVEVLAVEQIEARLSKPFELLKRNISNNAPAEFQQNLENNFELSFNRLSLEERLSIQSLSRIPGSFNLEMAVQRLVESGQPEKRCLAQLETLVTKSLVQSQNVDGIVTFSLLKTVQSYCRYLEKQGNYFGK